jgi:hypothetical protein
VEPLHAGGFSRLEDRLARTYQQQLDDLDALIAQIEAAGPNEVISVLGRSFTKRSLGDLYKERERLTPLAARAAAGGRDVRRIYPLG